jgi:hypothetical protein
LEINLIIGDDSVYGKVQGSRLYQKKGLHKVQPRWTCSGKACCPGLLSSRKTWSGFCPCDTLWVSEEKEKTREDKHFTF